MTEQERAEQLRLMRLENAIASNEMEGRVFTPAMRDLLDRKSRGLLTEAEFHREVLAYARSGE